MESIYWYATPAFIALAIKLWLVVNSDKRQLIVKNWPLALFFLAVSIFNLVEVVTYATSFGPAFYSIFIKLYNGSILLSLCFLMIFTARIAEVRLFTETEFPLFYSVFSIGFFVVFVSTDLFISGYEVVGYGFTRIPAEYFPLAAAFAALNIVAAISFLVFGLFRKNINQISQRRCKAILCSALPFMLMVFVLIMLMQTGLKVTGAVIIPFSTTYLLLVLVLTESAKGLFNFLMKTPYTLEYKTMKNLTRNLQDFMLETSVGNTVNLKAFSNEIERQLISHTVTMTNGNQAEAAKVLGISASSLCRKK